MHVTIPRNACHRTALLSLAFAGDSTVKLWAFEKQKCVATLSDHKQAVWSVKYHHAGDWLASCSLDHSVRWVHLCACASATHGHFGVPGYSRWCLRSV
jgi:WD40 repeat protein